MIEIKITFGIGQDKDGHPLEAFFVENALKAICHEAADVFGGCALIDSHGHWQNETSGRYVEEAGKVLVICCDESFQRYAAGMARLVRNQLHQQSVCLTITNCQFELI